MTFRWGQIAIDLAVHLLSFMRATCPVHFHLSLVIPCRLLFVFAVYLFLSLTHNLSVLCIGFTLFFFNIFSHLKLCLVSMSKFDIHRLGLVVYTGYKFFFSDLLAHLCFEIFHYIFIKIDWKRVSQITHIWWQYWFLPTTCKCSTCSVPQIPAF